MRVAGVQFDIEWEDPAENFRRVEVMVRRAKERDAQLVVLPEMFATGFSMNATRVADHAEATRDFLARIAVDHEVWLMAGYANHGPDGVSNLCVLLSPDGRERIRYSKIHPFTLAGEHEHFCAGDRMVSTEVDGVRVTPVICYDLRFNELFRATAEGTDLFVIPANWPDRRSHAWRVLLQARAIDCQAWVLGVNRVGHDGNSVLHRGDTTIVDPMGEVVSSLAWDEGVVVGDVDPEAVRETRRKYPFLDDRRPDLYARLF